ncbi:ABC transporter permease [Streptomyces avermitilis]|uniref:ABC transporter permease protein n=2 Tax=Streptomyces avermitilis TaxID=33903 RepID=Q82N92_STRAW|nr:MULTISPECIES: carbohydrate ABC transporter permease [Streptomyces]KUN55165.1 ABC transporter permease [Streptomyces avermitilis]MYS97040.1 ABC transporter permease subunit [Streptomyces sp. SID5469]OOV26727.1 ABC transporter permease [Streptomyces avermitilis]BAC69121.1 putative ABC transporter permease protein [Streptomyces avermitilis MA-4680 = NBRC 14893]BBJ49069.1 sugar ABC transporter permease [Streptomyces avermitilis]
MTQTAVFLTAVRRRIRPSRTLPFLVVGLLLALLLLFFVLPVIWLLLTPSKTAGEVVRDNPLSFGSFHQIGTAWRHLFAFQDGAMTRWLRNSAVYSGGSLILTLAVSVPAGYALALTNFRGRKTLLVITLVTMIMPQATLVLPIFLELNRFHLIGTIWSVILPFSFYPFGVYLVYIYFGSSLPRDLLSAARIDGCTEWQLFSRIALPLAKPVVGLVAFFSFVGNWNNFFLPYLVLPNSEQFPVQVGLNQLLTSTPSFNPVAGAGLNVTIPELALAILIAILPVLVLFVFSQRTLVSGMLAGASKE